MSDSIRSKKLNDSAGSRSLNRSVKIGRTHSIVLLDASGKAEEAKPIEMDESESSLDLKEFVASLLKQKSGNDRENSIDKKKTTEQSGQTELLVDLEEEDSHDLESLLDENTLSDSEGEISIDKAEEMERRVRYGFMFAAVAAIALMGLKKVMSVLTCICGGGGSPHDEITNEVVDNAATGTMHSLGLQSSAYSQSSSSLYGGAGWGTTGAGSNAATVTTGSTQ